MQISLLEEMRAEAEFLEDECKAYRQCSVKVADCANATQTVRIPNTYNVQHYGAWAFCKFCSKCLRKSPSMTVSAADQKAALTWDSEHIEAGKTARAAKIKRLGELRGAIYKLEKEAEGSEFWSRYHAHLASPEWAATRRKVVARCRNVCEGCADRPVAHVHHLSYEHLGHELLFELVGLCVPCHTIIHPQLGEQEF